MSKTIRSLQLCGLLLCGLLASCRHRSPTSPSLAPTLTAVEPTSAAPGTIVNVSLTGTDFVVGDTAIGTLNAGGVTVSNVVVRSATSVTATFAIAGDAIAGARAITVTTPGGTSGSQTFTVEELAPTIGSFTANPTTISAGGSATLAWSGVTNATACAIDHGAAAIGCGDGTVSVTPASTTTYTLTATGAGGSRTATTTVTVNAAPTIGSFTANPTTISAGGSATLAWSGVTNATACAIDHGAAAIGCGDGTVSVTPASTTTYTLTATGAGGSRTATTTVTVNAAPRIGSFTANPTTISAGGSATLAWSGVTDATACAIDHGAAAIGCGDGTVSVTPASTTTYTLTATGAGGSRTATTTVTVNAAAPTIGSFTANPTTISAGGSATLAWSGVTNATACAIDHGAAAIGCGDGTVSVTPASTTTYTLTATGAGGSRTATTTVTVNAAPTIGSFTANPTTISAGGSATLAWSGVTERDRLCHRPRRGRDWVRRRNCQRDSGLDDDLYPDGDGRGREPHRNHDRHGQRCAEDR